jgi:adenylylsulfate kinase
MQRDRKGTYRKGERGETGSVPGLQEPYEPPLVPELRIDTVKLPTEESVRLILDMVKTRFF